MPTLRALRTPTRPRRRLSLTRRFALISAVGMLTVGVGLVAITSQVLRAQAVAQGIGTAEATAAWTRSTVSLETYGTGVLDPGPAERLGQLVQESEGHLVALRLWTLDGTVLFDSRHDVAVATPDVARLDRATRQGLPDAVVSQQLVSAPAGDVGATARPILDVYVPVRYDDQVVGAAEVMIDHSATVDAVRSTLQTLAVGTAAGLALLWLVLFRTVRVASRRLQRSALENARLALLDSLTALPNRRMLLDRLDRAVERSADAGTGIGLLLLDVDRFKDINDSLGHDRGDELLIQVAGRLMEAFRGRDLVARLGGDEFAVLLPGVTSVAAAEQLAQRARAVFADPFELGGMSLHVETSIGVAVLPDHAEGASDLMRKADVAMYTAKQHRLGVAVYSATEDESSPARLVLQGELHRALTQCDELAMHYQPKVDLATGSTVGLEALMRWRHPARGDVPPSVFIPLAEQSGLIDDLTTFALRTVVRQLAEWGDAAVPVAVNLSAHTVTSRDVVSLVAGLLAEHQVRPGLLELEVTETALVRDPGRVLPVLSELAAAGIRVAIDDFGIGSTSISQLRNLPVAVLKIDRVFIDDLAHEGERPGSDAVIKAIVDLAHSFGMRVVAEGVEDARTARRLLDLSVDQAQGFWYSPAVAALALDRDHVRVPT